MAMSYNKVSFTLPAGLHIEVDVPAMHDPDLVELGLRGIFGTLVALTHANSGDTSRTQLVNLVANLLALSENITKRIQFTNAVTSEEAKHIIEGLLDSLGKEHDGK